MTDKAEFERLLDVYGFRCERFGQDLSTHARAQVVSAFAALASAPIPKPWPVEEQPDGAITPVDPVDMASAPVAGEAQIEVAKLAEELGDLASDMAYEANQEMDQDKASRAALIERGERTLRRFADAAPQASEAVRDAAFEAVRKRLCTLPRYSFLSDGYGAVRRVEDRSGNWIEFDAAHELFDPVSVDAALSAQPVAQRTGGGDDIPDFTPGNGNKARRRAAALRFQDQEIAAAAEPLIHCCTNCGAVFQGAGCPACRLAAPLASADAGITASPDVREVRADAFIAGFICAGGDAEYPAEWQYDKTGQPCCTAFVPAGEPIPTPLCPHTMALPLGADTDKKEM